MSETYITPSQCRMARAHLNWSQQELADRAGLVLNTISNFETGERQADARTVVAISRVLESAGLQFLDSGVIPRQVRSYLLSSYIDLLEDIEASLPEGGEVLKHCVDDRRSTPEVNKKIAEMRERGIRDRLTIADNNDFISGDAADYRQIPADYFASSEVVIIYVNKVAFFVEGKALVIVSESLAKVFKDQFEYWWKEGKVLNGA